MTIRKILLSLLISLISLTGCGGGGGSGSQGTLSGSTDGTGLERYYFGAVEATHPGVQFIGMSVVLEVTGEQVPLQDGTYSLKTTYNGLDSVTLRFIGKASDGNELDTAVEIPALPEDFLAIEADVSLDSKTNQADIESFEVYNRDEEEVVKERLPKPNKKEADAAQGGIEALTEGTEQEQTALSEPTASKDRNDPPEETNQDVEDDIEEFGIL